MPLKAAWLPGLLDSAVDAVLCFDQQLKVRLFNRAAEKLFGWQRAEVIGWPMARLFDRLPPELSGPRLWNAQAVCREGGRRPVELAISRTQEGAETFYFAMVRDLTDREKVWAELEERLRESELLHAAFDEGPAVMGIATLEGRLVHVNRAYATALGYNREELVGTPVRELRWGREADPELMEQLRRHGRHQATRLLRKKDGTRLELAASWQLLPYRGETHMLFMGIDVTAERAASANAREVENRFSEIVRSIKEVFWVASLDTNKVLYVSPAYETIWGRSCKSLLEGHQEWLEAIHPEDQPRVRAANARHPCDLQYRVIRPDGTMRWVHDRSFLVRDAAGEVIAVGGVAEDITERRELEQKFHQAQKLESIGRLAGGVAHDFNNLLTVISTTTAVLMEALGDADPDHDELAREIRHALDRGTSLTRQLLAFSRQQVIEPKVLDVNKVVADSEKMLRRLLGEDVELLTRLLPGLPRVRVDPGQLSQVLMNLCVNARDAMPTGGRLLIETCEHQGQLRLSVTDTGEGMSPEVQARIFEPFFTTKPTGKGTGLGLAVVFGVVEQAGGHVEVASAKGAGSTFHVYLPACADAPAAAADLTDGKAAGGSEAVLVVEDDEAVRRVSKRALAAAGYRVLEAGGGEEALALLARERVDLVVTDVVMPSMSGRVLAEQIKRAQPQAKVLFVSGYTDDAMVRHGVLREEVAFLNKPFGPGGELAKKVREVLDGGSATVIPIGRAAQRQA